MLKAFVITLSRFEDSLEGSKQVLSYLLKQGFEAHLFEGTYGNHAESLFSMTNRNIHTFPDLEINTNNWKSTAPGVKGCFHSHYRLWEKCLKINEPIAIFEDDVIFYRNYGPVDFDEVQVLAISYAWELTGPYRKYLEKDFPLEHVDYTLKCLPGAAGYIIKPTAAKKLVETYKNSYLPADLAINKLICNIDIHPRLIGRPNTDKISLTRYKDWIKP
jgi:GR25 family glycosyltransferase involved in LPS biosynthesis